MTTLGVIFASVLLVTLVSHGLAQTPSTPPGTIVLDKGWQTPTQGGSGTIEDLGALLSPFAQPSAETDDGADPLLRQNPFKMTAPKPI